MAIRKNVIVHLSNGNSFSFEGNFIQKEHYDFIVILRGKRLDDLLKQLLKNAEAHCDIIWNQMNEKEKKNMIISSDFNGIKDLNLEIADIEIKELEETIQKTTVIKDIKEKNAHCRESTKDSIWILMLEDFEEVFISNGDGYFVKLFKGKKYEIEIYKFDEHENGDLAIAFFLVQNKNNDEGIKYKIPTHINYDEVQIKMFIFRFDIIL